MKTSDLVRWGGLAGVLGGLLLAVAFLIHPPEENPLTVAQARWFWAHLLAGKGAILALLGLVVIYLKMAQSAGKVGLVGFLLSFASLASWIFVFYMAAFIEPTVARFAPRLVDPSGPLFQGPLGTFFLLVIISHVVGFGLLGYSALQAKVKPQWGGIALIAGSLPFLLFIVNPTTPAMVFNIAGIILGLGVAGLSYPIWSRK